MVIFPPLCFHPCGQLLRDSQVTDGYVLYGWICNSVMRDRVVKSMRPLPLVQLKQRLMTTGWDLSWLCYRPKRRLPLQVDVEGGQVAGLAWQLM